MDTMKYFILKLSTLAILLLVPTTHATQLISELKTPYDIQVLFDTNAATLTGASVYISKATKLFGSRIELSSFDEILTISKDGNYQVRSDIPMGLAIRSITPLDKIIRFGEGKIINGVPVANKISEQRGSSEQPLLALSNEKLKKIFFQQGKDTRTEPLPPRGVTDLQMMPYLFLGAPVPVKPITLSMMDAKRLFVNETLRATEVPITLNGETFPGVKFSRVLRPGEEASLDVWVRKADGAPVRMSIGLSAKYGATIYVRARKLPPVLPTKG